MLERVSQLLWVDRIEEKSVQKRFSLCLCDNKDNFWTCKSPVPSYCCGFFYARALVASRAVLASKIFVPDPKDFDYYELFFSNKSLFERVFDSPFLLCTSRRNNRVLYPLLAVFWTERFNYKHLILFCQAHFFSKI